MGEVAARPEDPQILPPAPQLPVGGSPDPIIIDPPEPLVVFKDLVTGDADIVGLVAYSIHKQHKHDWLKTYALEQGRMPDAIEAHSYLLGESTPRRLAIYRHLARVLLDERGSDGSSASSAEIAQVSPRRIEIARDRSNVHLSWRAVVGLCVTLVVALVALVTLFWLTRSGAAAAVLADQGRSV